MTYKIYSLGCKVNQYDAAKLSAQLEQQGLTKAGSGADIAIVYSCSVTGNAVKKNKQMIAKAKKENLQAKIILSGCWPRVGDIKETDFGVDFIADTDNFSLLWNFIFNESDNPVDIAGQTSLITEQTRARYFIKVQDGCEQFCSYCIIPYARGPLKSVDKVAVIKEIELAVAKGYREIVLSGIHLGLYGYDSDCKLADLVADILKIKNIGRVRLSSVELNEVGNDLMGLMINDKLCKHLHIPLQSGCDKILNSMKRPYNTEQFKNRIKEIRKLVPDIAITTDVIVGFPGESEEDFLITKKFIKEMNFSRLHVFSFSAHKRTPAYSMPDQTDRKIISSRANILRDINKDLEAAYKNSFKGQELEVVLEHPYKGKTRMKSEYYFDVISFKYDFNKNDIGQIKKIIF